MNIKIISQHKQSALVEFTKNGKLQRATVPLSDIQEGQISDYKLKMGIPYGIEWSKLVRLQANAEDLQENLRSAGIWTGEDARRNAQRVLGVLQKTYGVDLGVIMKIAKEANNA